MRYFREIPKQEKQPVVSLSPFRNDMPKIEEKQADAFELISKIEDVWKQSKGSARYVNEEKKDEKDWSPIVREIHGILPSTNFKVSKRKVLPRRSVSHRVESDEVENFRMKEMSADEYFKRKICRNMGIDLDWLQEKDAEERFRINEIKKVKQAEVQSIKAKKIMTEFLAIKKRDNRVDKISANNKELEGFAKADIFLEMIKIRSQVFPEIKRVDKSSEIRSGRTNGKASQTTKSKGNFSQRVNDGNIKAISSVAVNLQKEIQKIEGMFKASKRSCQPNRRRLSTLKTMGTSDRANKSLANSILSRAREDRSVMNFSNGKRKATIDRAYY
eukprot:TRINITY_DN12722_c0_g2_i1.p1 TRINITY_DN12722_c0_g2~~TRINITY_DN12722_c0_g2_i1.p1  ORF type:complete len:330 (+),score=87.88 TRINITY_DN12722_c0_g2_i1:960-1949(+)